MTTSFTPTSVSTGLRRGLGGVAGLVLGLAAMPALAASCEASDWRYTLIQGAGVQDATCARGNDKWKDTTELFGLTGWAEAQKIETGREAQPDGDVPYFGQGPLANGPSAWSVVNPGAYAELVLVLKQGNGYGAFLLDTDQVLEGTWATEGTKSNGGPKVGDLSHATLWYRPGGLRIETAIAPEDDPIIRPCDATTSRAFVATASCDAEDSVRDDNLPGGVGVVPLPAAGWLLLGGMGVLGGLGWRRSRRA